MIKKTVTAAVVALTLGGAGLALAQQQTAPQGPRFNAEDVAAMTDARIAGLKAGLKLNAEQEKNWPAVETALRDLAKQRADRRQSRRNSGDAAPARDAIARLRDGASYMNMRADSLKKLADAADPLYKSLDDGQKRRFGMLLRMNGGMGGGRHHWQRRAGNADASHPA